MPLVFQSTSLNSGITVSNGNALVIRNMVDLYTAGTGVTLSAGTSLTSVLNHGNIYAYLAFNVNTNDSRIVNYGTASAISSGGTGEAINLGGAGGLHTIENFGTITAQGDLIVTYEATGPLDIKFINHGVATTDGDILSYLSNSPTIFDLNNSGDLRGGWLNMSATYSSKLTNSGTLQAGSIYMAGPFGFSKLSNTGTLYVRDSISISSGYSALLVNHGVIDSTNTYVGIFMSATGDCVINSGMMVARLALASGPDRYEGIDAGVVTEGVWGEGGNDTLAGGDVADLLDGGDDQDKLVGRGGDDTLLGGAGYDILIGGDGNDLLDGGNNNDTMNGNAGADTMIGGFGNDILVGQDGDDNMEGGPGNDTMDGGTGNDILEGGSGNDILRGGIGDDALAGGVGLDLLSGGQDADNFVFRSLADAGLGATRDQILDFEQGLDTIVVAGLSPGVFEFRGTSPFAPSGNPELRLFETATGSTIVQFDADGNGSIDAEIRVANVTGLTADDFVL